MENNQTYHMLPYFKVAEKILMTMRFSFIICFLSILQVSANVFSQTTVTLDANNKSVKEILKNIEKQSDIRFFYSEDMTEMNDIIDINAENMNIVAVLDDIFVNTSLYYKEYDNNMIVIASRELLAQQQQRTITGTIIDDRGDPIPGANVIIAGTTTGVLSDMNGLYSITVPNTSAVLQYSFVGFKMQEVVVGDQTSINITLLEDSQMLDEIVVTGYSSERKKDIIGSVTIVNTEEMKNINSASVGSQMQGLASGVVVSSDGSPGGESKIRIRGFGSFGNSEPLYVIDGMPAESAVFNSLNPNDVESIQVLKDAASASIYGARAANGVVIVTTKQGEKSNNAKVSVDLYRGINYVSSKDFPDLLNAEEYGTYWWTANTNAGNPTTHAQYTYELNGDGSLKSVIIPDYVKAGAYSGATLEGLKVSDPALYADLVDPANYDFETHQIVKSSDTDWFDEVYSPAAIMNMQLGLSGGSDAGVYSISLNYFDQDNTSNQYAYYNRYTTRANSTFNVTKDIRIGENLQISYTKSSGSGRGAAAWNMQPILSVYDIMGNPTGGAVQGVSQANNPITSAWRSRNSYNANFGVFGNVFAEVDLLNAFTLRTSYGIDMRYTNSTTVSEKTYENAQNTTTNSLSKSANNILNWTWTNTLTYDKTIGINTIKVILGSEAIKNFSESLSAARQDYDIDNDMNFVTLNTGTGTQSNSGTFSRSMISSLFAKLDYSYDGKYLFNSTIRRDGSSLFGANNRYGFFPSAGIAWRISQESFMDSMTWLDDLKLKATWGIIGNQSGLSISNQYSQYVLDNSQGGYAMNGGNTISSGYYVSTVGNADARWEKNITTNVGFDATLINNRFNVSFEYFKKVTDDLLVTNQAPYTGIDATQPSVNVGQMTNRGADISLTNRGKIVQDLNYSITANFSLYRNIVDKVLDTDDSYLSGATNSSLGIITRTEAGMPISYIWTWQIDGFYETQEEVDEFIASGKTSVMDVAVGKWKIKDLDDNGIIDEDDKTMTGSPHPDFQIGFNGSLDYKAFDLSVFVFWSQGGEVFNLSRLESDFNRWTYNKSARMLYQSWTEGEDNSDALLPIIDISDEKSANNATDYFVEDATYVRIKNVQLGYTVPARITRMINVDNVRIYMQLQNPITFRGGDKPFSGLDPEGALSGDDVEMGTIGSQTPTSKQFVVGLNLNF